MNLIHVKSTIVIIPILLKEKHISFPSVTQQVRAEPEFSQAPTLTFLTTTLRHPWNSATDTFRELVKNQTHILPHTD